MIRSNPKCLWKSPTDKVGSSCNIFPPDGGCFCWKGKEECVNMGNMGESHPEGGNVFKNGRYRGGDYAVWFF